jgi:hypothetical protein
MNKRLLDSRILMFNSLISYESDQLVDVGPRFKGYYTESELRGAL